MALSHYIENASARLADSPRRLQAKGKRYHRVCRLAQEPGQNQHQCPKSRNRLSIENRGGVGRDKIAATYDRSTVNEENSEAGRYLASRRRRA